MKTESRFDKESASWDANPVRRALAESVGNAIRHATSMIPGWHIMDYGAGTGLVTLHLQPDAASVVAVDQSKGMLEKLEEKLAMAGITNVQTCQWDLETQAFPEKDFDLIASSMTLHHLRDVPGVFQRFAQSLKTGGWVAVADLDTEDGSFHGPSPDVFHQGFERSTIREWLEKAGFRNVSITEAHRIQKPDASGRFHIYPVFLAVARRG